VSPFGWVTERAQPGLLVGLTLLLVALSAWLLWLDQALVSPASPGGIVSYELAGHRDRSAAILGAWSASARSTAMLILGLDYLYLLVYPAWLSLAAARLGARLGGRWRRPGSKASWVVLGAAPLDAVENHALIQQLAHGPSALHAQLAWWCAVPKFALVAVALAFLALAGTAWLVARLRGS
jgi:hypothetical protein